MRESWGSLGYRGWEEATMELGNEQTRGRYLGALQQLLP